MGLLIIGMVSFILFCVGFMRFPWDNNAGEWFTIVMGVIFSYCVLFAIIIPPTVLEDTASTYELADAAGYYVSPTGHCVTVEAEHYDVESNAVPSSVSPAPKLQVHIHKEKTTFWDMAENKTEVTLVWE